MNTYREINLITSLTYKNQEQNKEEALLFES